MSDGFDRFDAIGKLEEDLVGALALSSHWEVRGADPVLTLRGDGVSVQLIPEEGGTFRISTRATAEQVAQVVTLLAKGAAPAPSRVRSRRLAAALG